MTAVLPAGNSDRTYVEFARIGRGRDPGRIEYSDLPPFRDHLSELLSIAEGLQADWWKKRWALGDLQFLEEEASAIALFGWRHEEDASDFPYRWDEETKHWEEVPGAPRATGAMGLVVFDLDRQFVAFTNIAGELRPAGLVRALEILLNAAEDARADTNFVQWSVDPVTESQAFDRWMESEGIARLTRLRVKFHVPNPSGRPQIQPGLEVLNKMNSTEATAMVASDLPGGIDPRGHPFFAAGIEFAEQYEGDVTAQGETADGARKNFKYAEHRVRRRLGGGLGLGRTLSIAVLGALRDYLAEGGDERHG